MENKKDAICPLCDSQLSNDEIEFDRQDERGRTICRGCALKYMIFDGWVMAVQKKGGLRK